MIKPHPFLACASCSLLWCILSIDVAAQELPQTGKHLAFRKADIPIEGEYIDAAFYVNSLTQELRPKIVTRKESVDFMTRDGAIRHRVITHSGLTATITSNGQFIGFYKDGFRLYKDTGELLWQDTPDEDYDGPERLYRISSQGVVCNLFREKGKAIFHNQYGVVTAAHAITNGMSRTLNGEWSPDGQFFLVSATMTGMYRDNRLFLFDARGTKLWEKRTDNRWAVEVEFSPKSRWIFLIYRDFSARALGIAILTTQEGSIVHELSHADLRFPCISTNERHFLVRARYLKERPGQKLVLFDIETGTKLFEIFLPKPILDYVIFSDEEVIYVLHQSELVKLDMTGAVVGSYDFGKLEASQNTLRFEGGSTADRALLRSPKSFLYLNQSK
jgi:outer membrane protein assembly factor BamB